MSVKSPRTIDNLGTEASVRYAKDKQLFEPQLIEESRFIPPKTEVSVLRPYVPSEFEELFSLGKRVAWALFNPPPDYYTETKPLFSYQLIPSLGSYEKLEADEEKLEDALKAPRKRKLQDDQEEEEEKKEKETLVAFFRCINQLDKSLSLINARRNQYHRG